MNFVTVIVYLFVLILSIQCAYPRNCFFSVTKGKDGVWWLVDPNGKPFFAKSVDGISIMGDYCPALGTYPYHETVLSKFPTNTESEWTNEAIQRMSQWKFNSVGTWSDDSINSQMPYFMILDLAVNAGSNAHTGEVADYFDPAFVSAVQQRVNQIVVPVMNNNLPIGYYSDGELFWGQDWRSNRSMLLTYMLLPDGSPGKNIALNQLKTTYNNDIQQLNAAWGINISSFSELSQVTFPTYDWGTPQRQRDESAFLFTAASQYYKVCRDAIRSKDTYHLYLGEKFAGIPPVQQDSLIAATTIYADGLAYDLYSNIETSMFDHAYDVTNRTKPFLIAEFSFKSTASGLPCTKGAGTPVPTLYDRALDFKYYVMNLTSHPAAVGYAWFEYVDEPALGRAIDGENSNYGMVDVNDNVYTDMAQMTATINPLAESNHAQASNSKVPTYLKPFCVPYLECPSACSGGGCCDYTTGVCTCFMGYSAADCSQNNTYFLWDFAKDGDSSTFAYHDNGWTDDVVGFRSENAYVANGQLVLAINNDSCPSSCFGEPYASAGWNTVNRYSFGHFDFINVKVLGVSGAFTTLRTMTGTFENEPNENIQMTILGKAPNVLRLSFFSNGTSTSLQDVQLSFDASQGYHTYSYDWSSSGITFYVDGVSVASAKSTSSNPIPNLPCHLSIEVFANSANPDWYGTFNYTAPIYTYVGGVGYSILPSAYPKCSPPPSLSSSIRISLSMFLAILLACI